MIKPWIFEFFTSFERTDPSNFDPQRCAEDYAWYLQRWLDAERAGFEGIFFSEHHFVIGRYSPSPNLLIATVAARTQRLRLGTMGNVVPFYEPWRLAEEYSMLDHLSGGRLEIGYSSGIGPKEFRPIGIPAEQIRPRFSEALDVIDAALSQPVFSHQGTFWKFDRLSISPRPLQQPLPPRWLTGLSPATATLAAERGYRFCTGFIGVTQVQAVFEAYREAVRSRGGEATPEHLGLRRQVLIGDDDAETREVAAVATRKMRAQMAGPPPTELHKAGATHGAVAPDAPEVKQGGPLISDEEAIAGSPSAVAEQIIDQCRRTGAGHLLAYPFGVLTRAQVARSYELWHEVIPVLRRANL